MSVVVQVRVQGGLSMSPCWAVHLVPQVGRHLIHEVLSVVRVVVVLRMDKRVFIVPRLLVPVQVVFQVSLPDPENYIKA